MSAREKVAEAIAPKLLCGCGTCVAIAADAAIAAHLEALKADGYAVVKLASGVPRTKRSQPNPEYLAAESLKAEADE